MFQAIEAATKCTNNIVNCSSVLIYVVGSCVLVVLFLCVFCDSFLCSIPLFPLSGSLYYGLNSLL